ncbi:hypothetical protein [Flectobacillus sp. BAB-3569]|uniref:hypothetical protein n=1 Tax=Flectobacillus sp. BAB-3569 TaxID=1509483 RepID=UPI0011406023|nr:hypothetical protein [Flectobacillus sp. BAB-3569]
MKKTTQYLAMSLLLMTWSNLSQAQRRNTPANTTTTTTKSAAPNRAPATKPKKEVDEENFNSIFSVGITTNTNSGLLGGFMVRKEIVIDNGAARRQMHYFNLELVNVDNYQESTLHAGGNGSGYAYGKKNYLFALRPQYGREISLFRKSSDGGINVNGFIAAGPTLGFLKPYYVDVYYGRGYLVSEPYDPNVHSINNIAGSGGFFKGLGNMKFTPGINIKAGLNFELDAFRQSNISLEVGFLADIYSKKVEIMALSDNQSVFTSGYLTIFFGGKK